VVRESISSMRAPGNCAAAARAALIVPESSCAMCTLTMSRPASAYGR
jgi:hypothetical protein